MILIYTLVTWLPVGELGNTVNQTKTNKQKNIIRLYFVCGLYRVVQNKLDTFYKSHFSQVGKYNEFI